MFVSKYINVKFNIKKLRLIANLYKPIKNLITTGNLSPRPRRAFKIEVYIDKLPKRKLKDFIHYNYGYLFSKLKVRFIGFSVNNAQ